jgi:hypothetical protein
MQSSTVSTIYTSGQQSQIHRVYICISYNKAIKEILHDSRPGLAQLEQLRRPWLNGLPLSPPAPHRPIYTRCQAQNRAQAPRQPPRIPEQ